MSILLLAIIVLFLGVRLIGQQVNNRTPEGGINEEMDRHIYRCYVGSKKLWKKLFRGSEQHSTYIRFNDK